MSVLKTADIIDLKSPESDQMTKI